MSFCLVQVNGLIPACAGKTISTGSQAHARSAHPRVCGENALDWLAHAETAGSSPRVRGKQLTPEEGRAMARLIPACAGKTTRIYRNCRAA